MEFHTRESRSVVMMAVFILLQFSTQLLDIADVRNGFLNCCGCLMSTHAVSYFANCAGHWHGRRKVGEGICSLLYQRHSHCLPIYGWLRTMLRIFRCIKSTKISAVVLVCIKMKLLISTSNLLRKLLRRGPYYPPCFWSNVPGKG